jgi:hypothetical protein
MKRLVTAPSVTTAANRESRSISTGSRAAIPPIVFQETRLEPFLDLTDDALIANPVLHEPD